MRTPIIILGTGGSSLDILDTLETLNRVGAGAGYECLGFLDDDTEKWGREYLGARVLGPLGSAQEHPVSTRFVNGIGSPGNFLRKPALIARTRLPDDRFETIVHPSASVSVSANLGRGTVILQQVTVTTHVTIGKHVIVLPNSVISHDDVIGDYTCIAGGVSISGGVRIGQACYLGTHSAIIENVVVGDHCLVGMGSVVLDHVAANSVVAGNPARLIRQNLPSDLA